MPLVSATYQLGEDLAAFAANLYRPSIQPLGQIVKWTVNLHRDGALKPPLHSALPLHDTLKISQYNDNRLPNNVAGPDDCPL